MSMSPTQPQFNHIVAFEVSKHELVVHILPADTGERIANTKAAVRRLLRREHKRNRAQDLGPLLVVCEATGGYERHVLEQAAALEVPAHRAHGSRTRLFARYQGKRAKTDPIDARLLALYGRATPELPLHRPPAPELEALRALRKRRDELKQMLRMELNRLEHATHPRIKASLARHLAQLEAECKDLEAAIATLIETTPDLNHKARLMQSVKGVGPGTAGAILAYLPELGTLSKAQAAGITGLAPHANELRPVQRRPTHRRWPQERPHQPLHGCPRRQDLQPKAQGLRPSPQGPRQTQQAHHHRNHAKARRHP